MKDKTHRIFINQLPCVSCGTNPPSESAHIRNGTDGYKGGKPSSKYIVPLCHSCHAKQHRIGEISFWGDVGKAIGLALQLYEISGDIKQGIKLVKRFYRSRLCN